MKQVCVMFVCLLILVSAGAQLVEINKVGKEPFVGKGQDLKYDIAGGSWWFQSYGPGIVKTVFRPFNYTNFEQVSDAVVEKPTAGQLKVTGGSTYTVEFDNNIRIVIQKDRLFYKLGNDVKLRNVGYKQEGKNRGFTFFLAQNEQFYGGGERALPMNRRGHKLELYNQPAYGYEYGAENLNFSVPIIMSSDGYAIFFDNPSKGFLDIGKTNADILQAGFSSGDLNFYIIFGKNADEILQNYSRLTGRQPLPPRWALGNFLSRFGYRSEAQVKDVVSKMRADKFPMDAVVFDLFWFGDSIKGTMGNLDWVNTKAWPDPKKLLTTLENEKLKSILITEPFILNNTKNYQPAQPFLATDQSGSPYILKDFYFGSGGLLDVFKKTAQDFIWKQYVRQIENGVDGWWVDLAEPERHPTDMYHNLKDYGVQRLMSADEVHNVYAHYWSKMLFEKYSREYSQTRLFNLNRSGFAGSQRYSIFPWTGDVSRSWSGLKSQLPILLGMSLSGIPYIHSDAGGFTVPESSDPELYTRWLQFAAFTPIFRPHATALEDLDPALKSIASEPTFYSDPAKSNVRKALQLRYQLLPYNYSMSFDQSGFGKPLMRPMNYYAFNDAEAVKATEQYMWGDHLLVAPILEKGAVSRNVYFPGGRWYNLYTSSSVVGGKWQEERITQDVIPVYVKEGTFLPLWAEGMTASSTAEYDSDNIIIQYYPSLQQSKYVWFDDDGSSSRNLEKGDFELVTFSGSTEKARIAVSISSNNPKFYKGKRSRTFTFKLPPGVGTIERAVINNKAVPVTNGSLKIPFDGKNTSIELQVSNLNL